MAAKSTKVLSAHVESVWVRWKHGTVSSVVLMKTDGTTFQLQGAGMWHWLNEWQPQSSQVPKVPYSPQTSLPFGSGPSEFSKRSAKATG